MSHLPAPYNEPVESYAPGTPARARLAEALKTLSREVAEVPVIAGRERIRTGRTVDVVMPHRKRHALAVAHEAGPAEAQKAIDAALAAAPAWAATPFEQRAAIFLRAADLLSGPWRARINAACMLGQSKTPHQSEIDAICEIADFFRWNVHFVEQIAQHQPVSPPGMWNRVELRPLEGFVFAITPFNFLSIGLNLPTAPILCGNVAVWKPATTSLLGCYHMFELLREAGLPDGVLNLLPARGGAVTDVVLSSPHLAGIHFTGSTAVFQHLWKRVAQNLERYRTFPRLVGETGGKDFVIAHPSADPVAVATAISRGGFEYQGQKCSAASRIYLPRSLWPEVRDRVIADVQSMKMGDVADFTTFLGAVIDAQAFARIRDYQELAKHSARVLHGGGGSDEVGFFIEPTLVEVEDPKHRLMQEEIFGPVVTFFVYDDSKWSEALHLVDTTSPYALTGAVFARDVRALAEADAALRNAAGNYYVNDKPTGAVVGQQPFGGARASGTNDKAGSMWNLMRWISPRTIKETFVPPRDWRYPYLSDLP
jgi:1-pyrroline-5-carboxylate dehydrogenase